MPSSPMRDGIDLGILSPQQNGKRKIDIDIKIPNIIFWCESELYMCYFFHLYKVNYKTWKSKLDYGILPC